MGSRRSLALALAIGAVVVVVGGAVRWVGLGIRPAPAGVAGLATAEPAAAHTAEEASEATLPYYPPNRGDGWSSLGVTAAHAAMVMRLAVDEGHDPMAIAREIVEPLSQSYGEILLYVHDPAHETAMPQRRIQWTPAGGYVETVYTP